MADDNKAAQRRFFDEVLQKGNLAVIDELVAPNFVDHNPGPGQAAGIEGVKQFFAAMRAAMSPTWPRMSPTESRESDVGKRNQRRSRPEPPGPSGSATDIISSSSDP